MKKTSYLLIMAFFGFLWVIVLFRLFTGHWIQFILCSLILAAPSFGVVKGFLTVISNERPEKYNLADDFRPIRQDAPPVAQSSSGKCYCPECGAENQKGTKFCVNCGKPLS